MKLSNYIDKSDDIYDHSGYACPGKIYFKLFGNIPSYRTYSNVKPQTILIEIKELFKNKIILLNESSSYTVSAENTSDEKFPRYYMMDEEIFILVDATFNMCIYYNENSNKNVLEQINEIVYKNPYVYDTQSNIHIIVQRNGGLDLKRVVIKDIHLDISGKYNTDFADIDLILKSRLNVENDKGVILLYGKPGTGKTTYIRHLINSIKKRIIFLPPSLAPKLTDPGFITFLLDYPNSILIIEDAENVIKDRGLGDSSSVSNLLNISDGLLSDVLNIQILCTFNSDLSTIDKALLRKGRIIAKYEFKELSVDKCNVINKELGFEHEITEPMTLSDLYNQEAKSFSVTDKPKIGFK